MKTNKRPFSIALKRLLGIALAIAAVIGMTVFSAQAAPANLQTILNSVKLEPVSTGNSKYDAKLQSIVGTGSTYDRVLRGYTWLAKTMVYDKLSPVDTTGKYWLDIAYGPLFTQRGSCSSSSAAVNLMLRYIGLPNVLRVEGMIVNSNGLPQYHIWNVVTLNGVSYIVDAQVEGRVYSRQGGGNMRYLYFFASPWSLRSSPTYLPARILFENGSKLRHLSMVLFGLHR